ncbi:MAG: carboxypeptidase-like regulatory domain-containing protein [Planctomycetaceae bacterium]|jgi:hypothetical protein|nr:carboxypeptidase-like regulatory domain-containing protein [Planctomycetaceae bacterium]
MKTLTTITILIVTITIISGCAGGIHVFTVTGEVYYNGQPVDNALVQFVQTTPDGRGAFASTDKDGKFVVATQGAEKSGAVPGDYIVLISKILNVDKNGKELPPPEPKEEDYSPYAVAEPVELPLTKNFLPEKYNDRDATDLKATVERKANHFRFELKD